MQGIPFIAKPNNVQDMPYLGALDIYKEKAAEHIREDKSHGSILSYWFPGCTGDDKKCRKTVSQEYDPAKGWDQDITTTDDNGKPLVLIGTDKDPIIIDGPVVVNSDVLIRGIVRGRGTIYSSRNVHILGSIQYEHPPQWVALSRDSADGPRKGSIITQSDIEVEDADGHLRTVKAGNVIGKVCDDGSSLADYLHQDCP